MKRESMIWLAVLLLSTSVLAASCGEKKEEAKEQARPVSVTEVKVGDIIQTEDVSATIEANMAVDVVPKVSGKVASVSVKEGQSVKKGQVLLQLETRELKAQVQQAQAALSSAKNAVTQARSGIKQAEASYMNAKNNFQRIEQLYKQQVVSQQDYENSKLQFEIAEDTYNAAKQQLQVDPSTGYQFLEAQVKQAEAGLELAQANLDNARVVAPASGTVVARNVDPGEMASSASPAITIMDMDTVKATAKITQKNITKINEGQEVKVSIASLGNQEKVYKIAKIIPAADKTNTYTLEVNIPNSDHSIKPGMTAVIRMNTDEIKDVMVLPRDAIVTSNSGETVFVLNKDKVKETKVVTGASTDELVEIKKGLKVGDKAVTAGQHLVADGDVVEVRDGGGAK